MLGVKTTSWSSSPTQVNTKRGIPCTNSCYGKILVVVVVCVVFHFGVLVGFFLFVFGFFFVFISFGIHTAAAF